MNLIYKISPVLVFSLGLSSCSSPNYRPINYLATTPSSSGNESPLVEAIGNVSDFLNKDLNNARNNASETVNSEISPFLPGKPKIGKVDTTPLIKDLTREPSTPGYGITWTKKF